jgi:hypothetical protein
VERGTERETLHLKERRQFSSFEGSEVVLACPSGRGKTLGSEEGKVLGSGLSYSRGYKLSRGFIAYGGTFDIKVGSVALA